MIIIEDMAVDRKNSRASWQEIQDGYSKDSGLAVVLVEGDDLSGLAASNNNSICEILASSKKYSSECQRFCGSVASKIMEGKKPIKYRCHAGLECAAVSVAADDGRQLVAITGRAFTKATDYREATERAVSGAWKEFPPTKFFENVLMTSSTKNIEKLAAKISGLNAEERLALKEFTKVAPEPENSQRAQDTNATQGARKIQDIRIGSMTRGKKQTEDIKPAPSITSSDAASDMPSHDERKEFAAWRAFFASIHDLDYGEACLSILKFIGENYGVSSLAWLENIDNHLKKALATGALETQRIRISLPVNDTRLLQMFRKRSSIELREQGRESSKESTQTIRLFPIIVGGKIRSALVLGEKSGNNRIRVQVSRFCQLVASELEIIRLRQALIKQSWLDNAFTKINKSLTMIDSSHFWLSVMQTAADLVSAGRGSLLVYDEKGETMVVRAAIGKKADFIESTDGEIGDRIAKKVWKSGKPLVVADINSLGLSPAPMDWEYQTGSFISYPLSIGKRRVGVLNVTDKIDGGVFDKDDLRLLRSIAPQLSIAIDRALLKSKAGEFEHLSVTDPLTGLLNRRYLEERLTEEIKRSDRHGYPMSFLMIDVDEFKSYNDNYTHPEGDKALQLVGQCLKESLRDADVAARYGGEEFSILLPQTNLEEARTIAERLREKIATTTFPNRQVTVSIGITGASSTRDTAEKVISAADRALFEAKRQGRNNVQIFEYVRKNLRINN